MRSLAIGMVMAWWFAQLRLELAGAWWLGRKPAAWLALGVALVLGALLQSRLDMKRRAHALPAAPLWLLAAFAGWQLVAPFAGTQHLFFFSTVRIWLEWAMAVAIVLGSGWLALRLAPVEEPVIGPDAAAPTVRLALGLGVVLSMCSAVWLAPALSGWAFSSFTRAFGEGRSLAAQLGWAVWVALPYALAAALVWRAQLGPRILASRPGLVRITVYLACWAAAQLVLPLVARGSASAGAGLGVLLVLGVFIAPALPLLNGVLLWAVLRMLFSLGRAAGDAVPAARGASPAVPAAPKAPADLSTVNEIKRLLSERKSAAALALYARALQARPGFDPGTSSVVPLAKQALKERRAELALRLLEVFGQRRPADTRTPLFRWLHGQALIGVGRLPEGLAELQALMLHDAHDPLAREARSLLAQHGAR